APADRRVLDPALPECASLAVFVGMAELAARAVRDHFDFPVRVQRPHGPRSHCVVVEDPQRPEPHPPRVEVTVEGKVPATVTRPSVDWHVELMNGRWITNRAHRRLERIGGL